MAEPRRRSRVLFVLGFGLALLGAPAAGAHGGGVLDLNACVEEAEIGERLSVHFDAFQKGAGPWCDTVPEVGSATFVFDLRGRSSSVPVGFRVAPRDARETVLFEEAAAIRSSGVVTAEIAFERAGVYEATVAFPDADLVFPVWVGSSPPLARRVRSLVLDVLERPYAILFVLLVGVMVGVFTYTRTQGTVTS